MLGHAWLMSSDEGHVHRCVVCSSLEQGRRFACSVLDAADCFTLFIVVKTVSFLHT